MNNETQITIFEGSPYDVASEFRKWVYQYYASANFLILNQLQSYHNGMMVLTIFYYK